MKITAKARTKQTGQIHTILDIDVASLTVQSLQSGSVRIEGKSEKLQLFGHYTIEIDVSALDLITLHTGSTVGFLRDEIIRMKTEIDALRDQLADTERQ